MSLSRRIVISLHRCTFMKISVIGNYGATNVGDDAILTQILKSLSGHEIVVFSADPYKTSEQHDVEAEALFPLGVRSFFKYGFLSGIKAIRSSDIVILGGGGLMQDNYIYACYLWAWQVFWVWLFRKPLFIYGTGVGPLKTPMGKRLAKWVYSRAKKITVRDKFSSELLFKLGIKTSKVMTTADPVFSLRKSESLKERTKNLFIISIRPWLDKNQEIIESFVSFLQEMKLKKDAQFVFVSMQQIKEKDHLVIDPVMERVAGKLYVPSDFSDLLSLMESAEFAIGMRYHFLIAALITKTPAMSISYSPKVDELFLGTKMEKYMISVDNLSVEGLLDTQKHISADYNNIKRYQKERVEFLAKRAAMNIKLFDELIKTFDQKQNN